MALIFINENIVDDYKEISEEDKKSLEVLNFVGANYKAGLSINLVSICIPQENKEITEEDKDSEVLKVVEINNQQGIAKDFLRHTVSGEYKRVSEVLNPVNPTKKAAKKKSMRDLMQQSVFHGRKWMGNNFIA